MEMTFRNRVEAGRRLARALERFRGDDVVVLGLPRGGVPVAKEIADALGAPLDVIVVRKLGTPGHEELGMGAIGEGDVRVLNPEIVDSVGASARQIAEVEEAERAELQRRAAQFRGDSERVDLTGRTAIVVDDGIATGSTAIAALQVARALGATRTILATPVAPHGVESRVGPYADEFVALDTPRWFSAVGQFYDDFGQTTDSEVIECLRSSRKRSGDA
jgi:putative phosphoribosyl transferase